MDAPMPDPRDDMPIFDAHEPAKEQPIVDGDSAARSKPFYPGLPSGTGIGKYRILERIRTYHNAVVYKARDLMLDRLVAVKQMSPELIDSPIACGNFKREAQLLARIPKDSRYILNIHELIEDEVGLFIVEEFEAGHWLESLIFKRQVDFKNAYKLLKTAATGLRTLHAHMIVHRDLHPGNIMMTKNGSAKLANLASAAHEGDLGPPPVITPQYAAPELLLEKRYDNRVDIYGLGMVIYEVCVGRQALERHFADIFSSPFPVGRWIDWQTDYTQHLPDASELNPLVPPQLSSIIRRMTAKNLDARYTSVDEVLDAIAGFFTAPRPAGEPGWRGALEREPMQPGTPDRSLLAPRKRGYAFEDPYGIPTSERPQRNTSTHTVRSTNRAYNDALRWERAYEYAPEQPRTAVPSARGGRRRMPRSAPAFVPPRPRHVAAIPAPPKVREIHKKRSPRILLWTMTFLLMLITAIGGGAAIWYFQFGPARVNPMEQLITQAIHAYEAGNFSAAEEKLEEATRLKVDSRTTPFWTERARFWLDLVHAQNALEENRYETVQILLRDAGRRGVNPAKVEELQQKAWLKRDAQRLAEEGMDHIAQGNLPAVEAKLDEYAQKAAAVGMDPERLKDSLSLTRTEMKHTEFLQRGHDALKRAEYLEAITAVERAEDIQITTATRELRRAINDAQSRQKWVEKGDQAMLDKDFSEAEQCYNRAIQILPGVELERKSRLARAYVLLDDANDAIAKGDLLEGEKRLKSSLWNSATQDAQARLSRMTPAFDAARLVRLGDRALDNADLAKARQHYEQALPHLPPPADAAVRQKLASLEWKGLLIRGDEAAKRGDRAGALSAFEEARKLGAGGEADLRIKKLQSPTSGPSSPPN